MNSIEAKKLSLPDLLAYLGYYPVKTKKGGYELWYQSPFRREKDASFVTSFLGGKWIWNDFGDTGGTIIDFVMRYENYNRVGDALSYLQKIFPNQKMNKSFFSFKQQARQSGIPNGQKRELEFVQSKKIENQTIIAYLTKERLISKKIAFRYLEEIEYRNLNTGKLFFAFGMKNLSGGYEIRAATDKYKFKSALIKKDISFIEGSKQGGVVNIFEGMLDFLSLLMLTGVDNLGGDSIIMHSLSSFSRVVEFIQSKGYNLVNTFLDNNKSGRKVTEDFKNQFGSSLSVQSDLFLPYEDINDKLKGNNV